MPVIRVIGLRPRSVQGKYEDDDYTDLIHNIKSATVSVSGLDLTVDQVTVYVLNDIVSQLESTVDQNDIVIDVTALTDKPERTDAVRKELAEKLAHIVTYFVETVGGYKSHGMIECFVHPFNPQNGYARN